MTVYSEGGAVLPNRFGASISREYPKWKYHWTGKGVTVKNSEEERALGGGWANTPAAFDAYKGARSGRTEQQNPVKWVDQWPMPGLCAEHRNKIKAALFRADAVFTRSPDTDSAERVAMRHAFEGIAKVLFDAGILTDQLLNNDMAELVWDSAIAAGWWRFASETRQDIFAEQLGHYWVWRDEREDWQALFRAEAAEWRGRLLEASAQVESPVQEVSAPMESGATGQLAGPGPRWEDIEIRFISDERVQIFVCNAPRDSKNFAEMGFEDRRGPGGKPNRAWHLLRTLSERDGVIPATAISGQQNMQKRAQTIRHQLCRHFHILENPLPFVEGVGYRTRFKITRSPACDN
jgi:hypothetical protein